MNAEALRELLNRRPFEPFQILTSGGETHEVKHPEFAILLPSRIGVTDPAADRLAIISLIHIAEIRLAEPAERG
jgi:hypothetical protein